MKAHAFAFHYGPAPPTLIASRREKVQVFTEDAFCGRLTAPTGKPREAAPFPFVNPLTGPIAVEGVRAGEVLAIHLVSLTPARDWGVSTISPNFGALSGARNNPNLQPEQQESVWICRVDREAAVVSTKTEDGVELRAPLHPFHGCLGVAPAYGEVRSSVVPDAFGGNLDIADIAARATLYLMANVDGALVYWRWPLFAGGRRACRDGGRRRASYRTCFRQLRRRL
jgi:amidase